MKRIKAIGSLVIMLVILGISCIGINATQTKRVVERDIVNVGIQASTQKEIVNEDERAIEEAEYAINKSELFGEKSVKNILVVGQDRRPGEDRQRSDSMILCSINSDTKEIILTSFMRDLYVEIPEHGGNRLNAAYSIGGKELLNKTIEQNFDIEIDSNVEVDFDGFINVLAAIGDLEIELRQEEADVINADIAPHNLVEGINKMNPEQLLDYARLRKVGNKDYERTERQRKIIMAAFKKVQDMNMAQIIALAIKVLPYVETEMPINEITEYIKYVMGNDITDIRSSRIPADRTYKEETIRGMAVLVPDLDMNKNYLGVWIYGVNYKDTIKKNESNPELNAGDIVKI